jgi:hypothetical protein
MGEKMRQKDVRGSVSSKRKRANGMVLETDLETEESRARIRARTDARADERMSPQKPTPRAKSSSKD